MDPEVLSPENSLKALAIMSAIPVVIFALWADAFAKHLAELAIKKPDYEKESEQEKIRIAGILGLLLQFTLFLSSSELRETFPLPTNLIFVAAIVLHLTIQSRLEKKVQTSTEKEPSEEIVGILASTLVSWLIGLTLQVLILLGSVKAGIWTANHLHFPSSSSGLVALGFGILGVGMGLFINYALGPLYFKNILPYSKVDDPDLLTRMSGCFQQLKLKAPDFVLINLDKFKITTLSWVGFQNGRGIFRPIFAVSRWMLTALSPKELDALILNHAAHIALRHPKKRFILTLTLITLTTLVALVSVMVFQNITTPKIAIDLLGPSVAILAFIISFRIMGLQSKKHEFETDVYTIEHLGVEVEDLVHALEKLDQQIQPDPTSVIPIHPDTVVRIGLIRQHFASKQDSLRDRDLDRAA